MKGECFELRGGREREMIWNSLIDDWTISDSRRIRGFESSKARQIAQKIKKDWLISKQTLSTSSTRTPTQPLTIMEQLHHGFPELRCAEHKVQTPSPRSITNSISPNRLQSFSWTPTSRMVRRTSSALVASQWDRTRTTRSSWLSKTSSTTSLLLLASSNFLSLHSFNLFNWNFS